MCFVFDHETKIHIHVMIVLLFATYGEKVALPFSAIEMERIPQSLFALSLGGLGGLLSVSLKKSDGVKTPQNIRMN